MRSGTWDQLLTVTQAKLTTASAPERRPVPLEAIEPNPDQPRRHFDPEALSELTASIKAHGVLQPVLLRPHPQAKGRYQLVAGERRFRASREAGLTELPAVVRELTDAEALELALVENVLREDISPLEEARTLKSLLETFGYSYAQLGERLGKNKAYVDHRVRLLKMPEPVQAALDRVEAAPEGKLKRPFSPRHAGVVVQLEDAGLRDQLIAAVFDQQLSVAELGRRKDLLKELASAEVAPEQRAKLAEAVVAGMSDRDMRFRLAATQPRAAAPEDRPVELAALQLTTLLAEAEGGAVSASKLLRALEADRRKIKALLAEPEA
ncbi:MAG: ParB/RepB/Spo0J family partition protein [Candidatus Sericytochromatia bacterium]